MEFNYFIGCDVSKKKLDFAIMRGKEFLYHKEIANEASAIKSLKGEFKKLPEFDLAKAIFCMEHTGIYSNHLLVFLHNKKANICLEAATHIKNSLGNIRGKNDKVDAIRIAEYAYKNREELRLWQPKREVVQKLAYLATTRARLVEAQKQLKTPLNEAKEFISKSVATQLAKTCQSSLKSIAEDIEKIEEEMDELIKSDEELNRLFSIVTSVKGIGAVTATQVIITTNEFKDINDPKKFACYAGVVPFKKESGMFKGKARVSNMANKTVKALLNMAAFSAIAHDPELKKYYERKINEEKKPPMQVVNAVRNKLVLRIFACVKQNRKYQKNYTRNVA